MSTFDCPHCKAEIEDGSIPDDIVSASPSGWFTYECECGAEFRVDVDWDPVFYVHKDTMKAPSPPQTAKQAGRPSITPKGDK